MAEYRKERAHQLAIVCKIFGNAKRVLILWTLADRKRPVGEIADANGASLQNTSQHLRLMKAASILVSRREGQTIYYSLAENTLSEICQLLTQAKKGVRSRLQSN